MLYETKITHITDGKEYIHGYSLEELIVGMSFAETIYLLLQGARPSEAHKKMMEALLVAAIDHGPGTASGQTARIVASAKNSLHVAVASGVLAMGERHGSAIEGAGKFFQEQKQTEDIVALVAALKEKKVRVPGFGHAVLTEDPRSATLFAVAKELGVYGEHCQFAQAFHVELNKQSSKTLPLNIDGSMAAILSDMGFDWAVMKGVFIIARVPGLVAQSYEEQTLHGKLRRLSPDEIKYTGISPRSV